MIASINRHIEAVRELIENGADINAKDNDKRKRNKSIIKWFKQITTIIKIK